MKRSTRTSILSARCERRLDEQVRYLATLQGKKRQEVVIEAVELALALATVRGELNPELKGDPA